MVFQTTRPVCVQVEHSISTVTHLPPRKSRQLFLTQELPEGTFWLGGVHYDNFKLYPQSFAATTKLLLPYKTRFPKNLNTVMLVIKVLSVN